MNHNIKLHPNDAIEIAEGTLFEIEFKRGGIMEVEDRVNIIRKVYNSLVMDTGYLFAKNEVLENKIRSLRDV